MPEGRSSKKKISSSGKAKDHRIKVMVVDDDVDCRGMVVDALKSDYQIVTAYNGLNALEVYTCEKPDLIITDIVMPHMDGFALISELRKRGNEPILAVSAGDRKESVEFIKNLGANAFLVKPLDIEALIEEINKLARLVMKEKQAS